MHHVNLIAQLHTSGMSAVSRGKHRFQAARAIAARIKSARPACFTPNSSMISARVHAGLTYYLRRIGRQCPSRHCRR
jgi:uncharacterized protein (DUF1015 family)